MIKVFGQTDTDFSSNGDVVLKPFKALLHQEDNFAYYIDFEVGLEYADYIAEGNIIVVDVPGDVNQPFRINNITKTRKKMSFRAYHLVYDAKNYIIPSAIFTDEPCYSILIALKNACGYPGWSASDILVTGSYECVRRTMFDAVIDVANAFGGHAYAHYSSNVVRFDVVDEIAGDFGQTIRYAKNMTDISCIEDWNDVVTKILPVGKDGILLNAVDSTRSIYVTSERQYAIPYTKTINFEQDINQEDFETEEEYKEALVEDLYRQASIYVNANSIPKVNYTLKAEMKIAFIGERIEVIDEALGINLYTDVIALDYDLIAEKMVSLEFGNFRKKLSDLVPYINQTVSRSVSASTSNISGAVEASLIALDDRLSSQISTVNGRVTATNGKIEYADQETATISDVVCPGILDGSVQFSVVLPKRCTDVILTALKVNIYNINGTMALPYTAGGVDVLTSATETMATTDTLTITITGTFTGTDKTPVAVKIEELAMTIQEA